MTAALDCLEAVKGGPDPNTVLTDHLFNDMPLTFRHAFRTHEARKQRAGTLQQEEWDWATLHEDIGPVPASIMRAGRDKRLSVCLNFDGEHVDLFYCRKAVKFLGAEHIMGITDHTEVDNLAGEALHTIPGSSLFWQNRGLVAAGSQAIPRQLSNIASCGLSARESWMMFAWRPSEFFGVAEPPSALGPARATLVSKPGEWLPLTA